MRGARGAQSRCTYLWMRTHNMLPLPFAGWMMLQESPVKARKSSAIEVSSVVLDLDRGVEGSGVRVREGTVLWAGVKGESCMGGRGRGKGGMRE